MEPRLSFADEPSPALGSSEAVDQPICFNFVSVVQGTAVVTRMGGSSHSPPSPSSRASTGTHPHSPCSSSSSSPLPPSPQEVDLTAVELISFGYQSGTLPRKCKRIINCASLAAAHSHAVPTSAWSSSRGSTWTSTPCIEELCSFLVTELQALVVASSTSRRPLNHQCSADSPPLSPFGPVPSPASSASSPALASHGSLSPQLTSSSLELPPAAIWIPATRPAGSSPGTPATPYINEQTLYSPMSRSLLHADRTLSAGPPSVIPSDPPKLRVTTLGSLGGGGFVLDSTSETADGCSSGCTVREPSPADDNASDIRSSDVGCKSHAWALSAVTRESEAVSVMTTGGGSTDGGGNGGLTHKANRAAAGGVSGKECRRSCDASLSMLSPRDQPTTRRQSEVLRIAVGCKDGTSLSVAVVEHLAQQLNSRGISAVTVRHRELERERRALRKAAREAGRSLLEAAGADNTPICAKSADIRPICPAESAHRTIRLPVRKKADANTSRMETLDTHAKSTDDTSEM
eukprot:CAMPEP_0181195452 /NCGR_PEP_ID=MMETSP1096-20121128/14899_1 /TAXON_ID=156174 ORGANISM="Chrysochromulina ericina, Strain CCMP281" /NCGR_SAMPLE_ID=MMETSP1096 /ASSEMBLY_ACC=CAM_ASM_000453 /LENGTH=517 /DNA_ID=CAMNT_0023285065 /DNA_START=34 /DNA_END=1587 /DNA_ORIENTATION=+